MLIITLEITSKVVYLKGDCFLPDIRMYYKTVYCLDFPGGPVAKILRSQLQGALVWSLVGELDPKMLQLRVCILQLKISHAVTKTENLECHN